MILLLVDRGFTGAEAASVQAFSLIAAAWAVPRLGIALDQGRHSFVLCLLAVGISCGLVPFAFKNLSGFIIVAAAVCFVISAATLNICVTRFTEGLADSNELSKKASLTYLSSNSALGVSSLIAYFFIEDYAETLITLDVLSSLLFILFLAYGYRFVGVHKKTTTQPVTAPIKTFIRQHVAVSLAVVALFATLYCHVSAIPLFYLEQVGAGAKRLQALMMFANTSFVVLGRLLYSRGWFGENRRLLLILAIALAAVPHMLVPYWISPVGALVIAAIAAVGEALAYPLITERIIGFFDKQQAGLAVGIRDMLIKFSLISAPLLGSLVYRSPGYVFSIVFGGLPLLAGILFEHAKRKAGSDVDVVFSR